MATLTTDNTTKRVTFTLEEVRDALIAKANADGIAFALPAGGEPGDAWSVGPFPQWVGSAAANVTSDMAQTVTFTVVDSSLA